MIGRTSFLISAMAFICSCPSFFIYIPPVWYCASSSNWTLLYSNELQFALIALRATIIPDCAMGG